MKTYEITTIEQWNIREKELREKGYTAWQFQFSWNSPEGLYARFVNGEFTVEFHTFNEEVAKAMILFKGKGGYNG